MLFHGKVGVVRVLTSLRVHKALFHLFQFDNVPLFIRNNTSGNVYWGIITVMGVHVWDNLVRKKERKRERKKDKERRIERK